MKEKEEKKIPKSNQFCVKLLENTKKMRDVNRICRRKRNLFFVHNQYFSNYMMKKKLNL